MPSYKVALPPVTVQQDGKPKTFNKVGESVELTEEEAQPLIALRVLEPTTLPQSPALEAALIIVPSNSPEALPQSPPVGTSLAVTAASRQVELQTLFDQQGYVAIKRIAEPLAIEKPPEGWEAAIPLILKQEGLEV